MKIKVGKKLVIFIICIMCLCHLSMNAYSLNDDSRANINLYSDVKSSDWFYNIADNLVKKDIVCGYPDAKLRPRDPITKAEFITLLLRANGYNEMISEDIWYKNYIERGVKFGIINNEDLEKYKWYIGTNSIAEMLIKSLEIKPKDTEDVIFSDIESKNIDVKWLNTAYKERLICGFYKNNSLIATPNRPVTRAEAFEIISNLIDYKSNKSEYIDKVNKSINLLEKINCKMFSDWQEYLNKEIEYPKEIREYIDKNYSRESIHEVNTDNLTYTIITSGPMPSSGYNIVLKEAYEKDNELVFKVKWLNPSGGYSDSITYPVAIIKTDSSYNNYKLNYIIEK